MIELSLHNICKYYGAVRVFEHINLELHSKGRLGLVGSNGTGKTTLFKIIAGLEDHTASTKHFKKGTVNLRKGNTVGYLDQIPEYEDLTVLQVLQLAFEDLFGIEAELKALEVRLSNHQEANYDRLLESYGDLQVKFEHLGGYAIKEQLNKIIAGFNFLDSFLERDFSLLSGGEKTRVILAKILLEKPSVLLLDEPSNHLDIRSVEWLEDYLKDYEGAVIIISHDRYFLDHTVTEIIEMTPDEAVYYKGNYSYYVVEKERRLLEALEAYKKQQRKIKAMEEAIKRFRDWGTRADNAKFFKKAKELEKRIEKMDHLDRPNTDPKKIGLSFKNESRSGKEVIRVRNLNKNFDEKVLFEDANLDIRYQEVAALLGDNGTGKSTLLKMILEGAGDQDIKISPSAKIGYMEQEIAFLEAEKSILSTYKDAYALTEFDARNRLARFLFYADDVFKKVKNLSGGEKARLSLCMMMEEEVNLLIMDEPTNHVDIESREMIEQALSRFAGTVLFISHDRYFIDKLATKIIAIEDKKLVSYEGDYAYYKDQIAKRDQEIVPVEKIKKTVDEKPVVKKVNKFKLQELEDKIAVTETDLEVLQEAIDANVHDYEKLMGLQSEMEAKQVVLDELLEAWMAVQNP